MNKLTKALVVAAVCILAGVLITTWVNVRRQHPPAAGAPEPINPDELKVRAERGEAQAQQKLAALYLKGQGVTQDYKEAAKWCLKAAEQGNAQAQEMLAELHAAGRGVPRDDAAAAQWYQRAAEQGLALAQYNLAVLYLTGKGVKQSIPEALKWYRSAAEQGDAFAQFNLGMRYYEGKDVVVDAVEAYKWLSLAAAGGIADADKARDVLKRSMSREQLAQAQARVASFSVKKSGPSAP
jgi:TPR repeat protein